MGINYYAAKSQAKALDRYVSDLRDVRNNLNIVKSNINNGWKAKEMIYVNDAIDKIDREIYRLSSSLDSLSDDIVRTAREIKKEEERARERARAR